MHFASPYYLWLLALLIPMIAYYVWRTMQGGAAIQISTIQGLKGAPRTVRYYLRHLPFVLRAAAFALLVVALARPQDVEQNVSTSTEGIDIMLSIDVSGSMLARDFSPDRLTAAQDIGPKFIIARPTDRLGLVVFAGEAFTQSPITTDHVSLVNLMNQIKSGMIADGTAIGNGLATAVNRLKESDAPSKVIILLTDGVNNSGQIDPLTAAQIAADYGIRVYTIGVGSEGVAPTPTINEWGGISFVQAKVEIDEDILRQIADKTGGRYFRATDNTKLAEIYAEIDQLEKTKVEVENFVKYSEVYHFWLLLAVGLLMLEMLSRYLFLRQIP